MTGVRRVRPRPAPPAITRCGRPRRTPVADRAAAGPSGRRSRYCTGSSTPARTFEERRVDLGVVKAGHRAAGQAQRAGREDEIGALQRAVAHRSGLDHLGLAGERGAGVDVRIEHRQLLVELEVERNDGRARRLHRLVVVAGRQRRAELCLGFGRTQEHEARWIRVHRRRRPLEEIVEGVQRRVGDRLVAEGVEGARGAEQLVEGGIGRGMGSGEEEWRWRSGLGIRG